MKILDNSLINFLNKERQYSIPIFQRNYSWDSKDCLKLLRDIIDIAKDKSRDWHFIGSIIYQIKDDHAITENCVVIDGQQRITTISLLLIALRNYAKDYCNKKDIKFNAKNIEDFSNQLLFNKSENYDLHYKLKLSETEFNTYKGLLNNIDLKYDNINNNVYKSYEYLYNKLLETNIEADLIKNGIEKLKIADIKLLPSDKAQLVFETVNNTGKRLSTIDLIKNYILMNVEYEKQNDLFNYYWKPIEEKLTQEELNNFFRYYLAVKTKETVPTEFYDTFKEYVINSDLRVENIVKEANKYLDFYLKWKEPSNYKYGSIRKNLINLKAIKREEITPIIMSLLFDFEEEKCSKKEVIKVLEIIESYLVRMRLCFPDVDSNKIFITFLKCFSKNNYSIALQDCIKHLPRELQIPTDEILKVKLRTAEIYGVKNSIARMLLDKIEIYLNKDYTPSENHSIEHIMPQTIHSHEELCSKGYKDDEIDKYDWEKDLGNNWQELHQTYVNTLGNLTLSGYNKDYSNYRFKYKKEIPNGYKESTIRLTSDYVAIYDNWSEKEIIKRSDSLSEIIAQIWKYPV